MANRTAIPTTPDAILLAFQTQLVRAGSASGLTTPTTYITCDLFKLLNPAPGVINCALCLLNMEFDESVIDGGGVDTIETQGDVVTVLFSDLQLDEQGRDAAFLTEASSGLYIKSTGLVKDLAIFDPKSGADAILKQGVFPRSIQIEHENRSLGSLAFAWHVVFDWNLS